MERIIDISSENLHLGVYRGFLIIQQDGSEIARVAFDDIAGLITHSHGLTWSNTVFVRLAERQIPVIICAANHAPVTCLWPIEGHHLQASRMRMQVATKLPLKKQAWQKIIARKIEMQAAVLGSLNLDMGALQKLAKQVRSGDPQNIEAQAARRYWGLVFNKKFKRDKHGDGINGLLNYGYIVLRAIVSRAICAAGLHPSFGIHHSNQGNAFALADDLMEPYRALVDRQVISLVNAGIDEVTPVAKTVLASISSLDMETDDGFSPLSVQISKFVYSLVHSFESRQLQLELPKVPSPLMLSQIKGDF